MLVNGFWDFLVSIKILKIKKFKRFSISIILKNFNFFVIIVIMKLVWGFGR